MMKLRNTKKVNEEYGIIGSKKYEVGRKAGDISFPDDNSISRNHAEIILYHPIENLSNVALTPYLKVLDIGSKFGTYANDEIEKKKPLKKSVAQVLHHGDRIRFGLQWNEYKVEYTPLCVTPSALTDSQRLKSTIWKLGGHLVNEWTQGCNYVVMDSLTLTIKAVCAILAGKHIVTSSFFLDYMNSVETRKQKKPNPLDYLPPLGESSLANSQISFNPIEGRQKLFAKKIFAFTHIKQAKKIGIAVICGGGTWKMINSLEEEEILSPNVLLVSSGVDISQLDPQIHKLTSSYIRVKRQISESEVGLAAVFNSIEKHCNPYYNLSKAIFSLGLASQTQSSIVVPETQYSANTQLSYDGNVSRQIIDESFMPTPSQPSARPTPQDSNKRRFDPSHSQSVSQKRIRHDPNEQALSALFNLSDDEGENVADNENHNLVNVTANEQKRKPEELLEEGSDNKKRRIDAGKYGERARNYNVETQIIDAKEEFEFKKIPVGSIPLMKNLVKKEPEPLSPNSQFVKNFKRFVKITANQPASCIVKSRPKEKKFNFVKVVVSASSPPPEILINPNPTGPDGFFEENNGPEYLGENVTGVPQLIPPQPIPIETNGMNGFDNMQLHNTNIHARPQLDPDDPWSFDLIN